jgi:hypothetical protein
MVLGVMAIVVRQKMHVDKAGLCISNFPVCRQAVSVYAGMYTDKFETDEFFFQISREKYFNREYLKMLSVINFIGMCNYWH